ncbi:hypothetical protein Tco_0932665 [Tanacetum coccineum]
MIHYSPNLVITYQNFKRSFKLLIGNKKSIQSEYATSYEPKVEIPEVELKELPPHLEYAFLEENNKLPTHNFKKYWSKMKRLTHSCFEKPKIKQLLGNFLISRLDPGLSHKILLEDDYQPSDPTSMEGYPNIP